jgi:hypothetical protein
MANVDLAPANISGKGTVTPTLIKAISFSNAISGGSTVTDSGETESQVQFFVSAAGAASLALALAAAVLMSATIAGAGSMTDSGETESQVQMSTAMTGAGTLSASGELQSQVQMSTAMTGAGSLILPAGLSEEVSLSVSMNGLGSVGCTVYPAFQGLSTAGDQYLGTAPQGANHLTVVVLDYTPPDQILGALRVGQSLYGNTSIASFSEWKWDTIRSNSKQLFFPECEALGPAIARARWNNEGVLWLAWFDSDATP